MNRSFSVQCEEISREAWRQRNYRFTKSATLARYEFEKIAKTLVGWSDNVEMEIKFHYMFNDTVVYVQVKEIID